MMTKVLVVIIGVLLGLAITAWLVASLLFEAPDLAQFDAQRPAPSSRDRVPESDEHAAIARTLAAGVATPPTGERQAQLASLRRQLDARGEAEPITAAVTPVDIAGVRGEWVVPAQAEPGRRLLYLHGGGYVMGSARSHRPITARMAEVARAAVLAVDYRLLPEHSRQAGIDDVRLAYRWIRANGPEGELDSTYASPSLKRNVDTDVLQRSALGAVARAPRPLVLWMGFLMNRMNPRDSAISPLLGDLSDLPPTLVQASAADMFLDDAVRYANKANAQRSKVVLQVWPHTLHVWHAFATPETDAAFVEIARFLAAHLPRPVNARAS